MTAASGTDLPAANGVSLDGLNSPSITPASSPTSDGVGEGRGPCGLTVHGTWPNTGSPVDPAEAMAVVEEFDRWWGCADPDPAVSRTLAVAEQTVEKARERR